MKSRTWYGHLLPPLLLMIAAVLVQPVIPMIHATGLAAYQCAPSLPVDGPQARHILENERPFTPTDLDLFYSWNHPDWADVSPPESQDGPMLGEDETRDDLKAFLTKRFPCSPEDVFHGLSVYGDPVARQKFPDPTLRAALAALVGTVGEPAISYLLYEGPVTSIHLGIGFMVEDGGISLRSATTWVSLDGTQQIIFDRKDRTSHFASFSALLVHEALHVSTDDEGAGEVEETIALAIEALVYMEMLLTDPGIASDPGALTRSLNNRTAMLRLNSAPEGSDRMTLLVPGSDVNIDPTSTEPITQFYDYYNRIGEPENDEYAGRETPGNPLLQAILERLAEGGATAPISAAFDAETVDFLNRNHATLTAAELIGVACILRLDVECG